MVEMNRRNSYAMHELCEPGTTAYCVSTSLYFFSYFFPFHSIANILCKKTHQIVLGSGRRHEFLPQSCKGGRVGNATTLLSYTHTQRSPTHSHTYLRAVKAITKAFKTARKSPWQLCYSYRIFAGPLFCGGVNCRLWPIGTQIPQTLNGKTNVQQWKVSLFLFNSYSLLWFNRFPSKCIA